jgi:pterin-4a-carbinolamine dehydratase
VFGVWKTLSWRQAWLVASLNSSINQTSLPNSRIPTKTKTNPTKNSPDTPLVPADQIPSLLALAPAWALAPDGRSIARRFVARNFLAAVAFVNALAPVAEAEGHHPDVSIRNYRCAAERGGRGVGIVCVL